MQHTILGFLGGMLVVSCDGDESPRDDDDIDADADADADADTDSDTMTGSETETPTETDDCWSKYEIRTPPELCEMPCDGGGDCTRPLMACYWIDACGRASGFCATDEEICAAYGCLEPCCASSDSDPMEFSKGGCGRGCCP
jgi:hypothetical protein